MEDNRQYKITDNINGVYYELNTIDEYITYKEDIIKELTIKEFYSDALNEKTTYYKPIVTIENEYTPKENNKYILELNIYDVSNNNQYFKDNINPYSIYWKTIKS